MAMNDSDKDVLSNGLVSGLCLALAIPIVGIGFLWPVSPIIALTFVVLVTTLYVKIALMILTTLQELEDAEP